MEGHGAQTGKQSRTDHVLEEMRRRFPVFEDFLPLASGIEEQLATQFPRDPPWRVIAALRRHVHDARYLRTLLHSRERYTLNGEISSYISEGERQHAQQALLQRGEPEDLAGEGDTWPGSGAGAAEGVFEGGGKEEGIRQLIALQSAHKFGSDMMQEVQPYLERLASEDTLTETGVRLLDMGSQEEWLALLRGEAGA